MVQRQFDYEEKHQQILDKVRELQELSKSLGINLSEDIAHLEKELDMLAIEKYKNLSAWEKVLLSRHPDRPTTLDYIQELFDDWVELHGDRLFGDDKAIIGGIASFKGQPVTIIGHQKGKNTRANVQHNFGMPHPEGYRKAERLALQAEKFGRPVISFVDTPGAYPGVGAEERGQSIAIAQILMKLSQLRVPVITFITGQGGSGGALALAVADRCYMLEHAVFSVASPEACASILWRSSDRAMEMAEVMKITAQDLKKLGIVDGIIPEGKGVHQDFKNICTYIEQILQQSLTDLEQLSIETLLEQRWTRLKDTHSL